MAFQHGGPPADRGQQNRNYSKPSNPKPETVELHFVQIGREHEGIKLTKYGDKISLNPYFESADGKRYMRFCYPKLKEGPAEHHYPMGVDIGKSYDEAIRVLTQFVTVLQQEARNAGNNREGKGR